MIPATTDSIIFKCPKDKIIVDMSDLPTAWSCEEDPVGVVQAKIRENKIKS